MSDAVSAPSPDHAGPKTSGRPTHAIGEAPLTIDDLVRLARGAVVPELAASARARMKESAALVASQHAGGQDIYGVTTSVGGSVGTQVALEDSAALSLNVLRMHGVGSGRLLDEDESAAVVATRLCSLAQGLSGIRPEVADFLIELLRFRVLPRIPAQGSVGASGDLTPLSYVAATIVGEREVSFRGREVDAAVALAEIGLTPLVLQPKEGLALMNGTGVSTALACLGWDRARSLARLASTVTALTSISVAGNAVHFDDRLHAAKPHPGQRRAADWIRADLEGSDPGRAPERLQDRYSIRCAPHVLGVLVDALAFSQDMLETELNGVSDNPIVTDGEILHGGNFYGGHVGFACDSLKVAVANVACLLDRQIMLLCNPAENAGLPTDLVGVEGPAASVHNGFKAASIAASSLAAEALKLTMPASAFSRSTELHNQDKVPMATIAANDLLRIVELTEQVASLAILACCQAQDLRGATLGAPLADFHAAVRRVVPRLREDRRMDLDQRAILEALHGGELVGAPVGDGGGHSAHPARAAIAIR